MNFSFRPIEVVYNGQTMPAYQVDAVSGCGVPFQNVATILEPDRPNPLLQITTALGFNAVKNILAQFEELKRAENAVQRER